MALNHLIRCPFRRLVNVSGPAFIAAVIVVALLGACQAVQPAAPPDPAVDRVGFPENYRTDYTLFYEFDRPDNKTARVIYANEVAAAVRPGEAYPYGSVFVMEVYRTKRDDAGNVLRDASGRYDREELSGIFVMRKEPGFGEKYGAARSGDWEYVAYRADKSFLTPPQNTMPCASCHVEAGMGRDWVFGTQRHFEETPGLAATSTSTNTVAVSDYVFGTQVLTVPVGTELHWTSHDVVFHTVTGDDFTGILRPGSTFRHTFEEPGVHDYFCAVHPSMTGTIVVTEP